MSLKICDAITTMNTNEPQNVRVDRDGMTGDDLSNKLQAASPDSHDV
jgi:hypothetical protein